jgi:two-component system, chemotaxis family, sensor kinase CheA
MIEGLEEIFYEFIEEGLELLSGLENSLTDLEKSPDSEESIDEAFRCIHTLKGNSACFELVNLTELAHVLEDILGQVRDKKISVVPELLNHLIEGVDKIGLMLGDPDEIEGVNCEEIIEKCKVWLGVDSKKNSESNKNHEIKDPFLNSKVTTSNFLYWIRCGLECKEALQAELSQMGTIHESLEDQGFFDCLYETVLDKAFFEDLDYDISVIEEHCDDEIVVKIKKEVLKKQEAPKAKQRKEGFARISYTLLDKLIELSGELILCRNQFTRKLDRELTQDFHALSTLINDMQDGLMMTRMQPFSIVSSKFPRMVRDTARKLNKKVNFEVRGDSVEMDRTILEGAKSIFTHLVRNSLDHGIELPEARRAKGKDQEGNILIDVSQNTGFVQFLISDDGSGIDPQKLKEKALSKSIITQSQMEEMSDDAALNLIYSPGFSTNGNVTDISGRGVGMDVVKTEVEKLSGSISLKSDPSSGTLFTIKLPQSMAILHSLIIQANNQSYAIPRNNISEVIRVDGGDKESFKEIEGSTLLRHRGRLLPLLDLNTMINHSLSKDEVTSAKRVDIYSDVMTIIVVKQMEKSYGLIVENVQYQEEVVIKPLNEFLESFKIFTGMTILSTGKVCFILDVQALAEKGGIKHTDVVSISGEKVSSLTSESFFVFENSYNEQFAIPIGQVSMIHQVSLKELAICGESHFIDILGMEYKVIDLTDFINIKNCNLFDNETVYIVRVKGILGKWVIACKKLIGTQDFPINLNFLPSSDKYVVGNLIKDQTVINFLDLLQFDKTFHGNAISVDKAKVLVVDDSRLIRKVISQFLQSSGFEVVQADNGLEAISKIEGDDFNLILSDIEMPKMNGFELVSSLKEKDIKDIPIIALTSLASKSVREKALDCGFDDLVLKFDTAGLVDVLKRYIG